MTRIIVVRARILKKLEGTTPLCTLAPSSRALEGGCARNSVVNSTTIGGLENTIAITLRHGGGRNEWDVRARLAEADYAEGILSASERAPVYGNKDATVRDLF